MITKNRRVLSKEEIAQISIPYEKTREKGMNRGIKWGAFFILGPMIGGGLLAQLFMNIFELSADPAFIFGIIIATILAIALFNLDRKAERLRKDGYEKWQKTLLGQGLVYIYEFSPTEVWAYKEDPDCDQFSWEYMGFKINDDLYIAVCDVGIYKKLNDFRPTYKITIEVYPEYNNIVSMKSTGAPIEVGMITDFETVDFSYPDEFTIIDDPVITKALTEDINNQKELRSQPLTPDTSRVNG